MDINQHLSCRRFLSRAAGLAGLVAGGTILAACGETTTSPVTTSAVATPVLVSTSTPTTSVTTTQAAQTTAPVTTSAVTTKAVGTATTKAGGSRPTVTSTDPNFADVGAITDFADNNPQPITLDSPKKGTQENGYVIKSNGQFLALSDICTHQGCEVGWAAADNLFECPCHGSRFDLQGNVSNGPANRPLNQFQTKVVNGRLLVSYKSAKNSS